MIPMPSANHQFMLRQHFKIHWSDRSREFIAQNRWFRIWCDTSLTPHHLDRIAMLRSIWSLLLLLFSCVGIKLRYNDNKLLSVFSMTFLYIKLFFHGKLTLAHTCLFQALPCCIVTPVGWRFLCHRTRPLQFHSHCRNLKQSPLSHNCLL